jgi:hypothetical protein
VLTIAVRQESPKQKGLSKPSGVMSRTDVVVESDRTPTNKEKEIEDIKETQMNHPKVGREKLDPKNRLTLEKTAPPKIFEQENPEFPRVSTRVVMEQFIKPEKYAPYPPRKATKSPVSRKEGFDVVQNENRMNHLYYPMVFRLI